MNFCENKFCQNPFGNPETAEYCMSCGSKVGKVGKTPNSNEITNSNKLQPNNISILARNPHTKIIQSYNQWLTNKVGIPMTYIPKGRYWMGSNGSEIDSSPSERTQHLVSIAPFYLSIHPISQKQYQAIVGFNPASYLCEENPVETVTFYQANEFCQILSQLAEKRYRLPTESEWEYACRAGEFNAVYNFGSNIDPNKACYKVSNSDIRFDRPTKIGTYKPNKFNLHDMHGNVWEWCQDSWHPNYHEAPRDGSAWDEPDAELKVIRGGSWRSSKNDCRCASRNSLNPASSRNDVGFRIVCDG